LTNGAARHLINDKDSILSGSFKKSVQLETVEIVTQTIPISGRDTRLIKGVVYGTRGARTEDFVLQKVAVVDSLHVNIVSEAPLHANKVWYLGLDNTLRASSLAESTVF
jgi:hypothetical protein